MCARIVSGSWEPSASSSEAAEKSHGVVLRLLSVWMTGMLHPELVSSVSFPTQTPRAPLVFCIRTVWYQSFFQRHFRFSRTRFPPPHIRTNIDSAVVCCAPCACISRSAAPGHLKLVESGHFLSVSGRSGWWPSAEPFSLGKRSLRGPLKTFCPARLSV